MNGVNGDASSTTRRGEIEDLIRRELERHLRHARYDPSTCAHLCRHLCASIRSEAKQLNGGSKQAKKKTVVNVIVGQDNEQEVNVAVRTVADPLRGDEMASAVFRNKHLFAIGLVHEMTTTTDLR